MDPQSSFMFLSICNEALGMTPEQILNSDFVLLSSILRERSYTLNDRSKDTQSDNNKKAGTEYIEITDFVTGEKKSVPKVKSI